MAIDYSELRNALAALDWGDGLTRDGIRARYKALPQEVFMHLPSEKVFRGAEEVVTFARLRLDAAAAPEPFDEVEVAEEGGPTAWGESVTGLAVTVGDAGEGSGSDSGYTGSGPGQTGVGSDEATYEDENRAEGE